jgi:chromosome segregation ATPase
MSSAWAPPLIGHRIQLKEQIKKHSPDAIKAQEAALQQWEEEFAQLQGLMPVNTTKERIRTVELPALEKQIKTLEADLPSISEKAEQASNAFLRLFKAYSCIGCW